MRIKVDKFFSIQDSLYARVSGRWDSDALSGLVDQLEDKKPAYFVLDPTEALLSDEAMIPIEQASESRKAIVNRVIKLMIDNPRMCYIVINRNNTPALKTAVSAYEAQGIADRYIFVRSEGEALSIIREHRDQ